LPDDIKNLLSRALIGKNEQERDEILDNISEAIKDGSNTIDADIKEYLEDIN
jgi:hypothetical protein